MKKVLSIVILTALLTVFLCGCSDNKPDMLKIGLITNGHPIDSDPYNNLAWAGLNDAAESFKCECIYIDPETADTNGFKKAAEELYDAGCRMIIAPHSSMKDAVSQLQGEYKDCRFICLGFGIAKPSSNTVCITFSQLESGFIAGIAAAVQLKDGAFGGIFGMDIPSSRRYSYGFTCGVNYANANLGTTVSVDDANMVFIGSYNDPSLAEKLASEMYISGIKCIFTDGNNTSSGVYSAAKSFVENGNAAYVAGCENDSVYKGYYASGSVTLVSVIGLPSAALKQVIKSHFDKSFQGGATITSTVADDSVGIDPNCKTLSPDTVAVCNSILEKLKNRDLILHDPISLLN